MSPREEKTWMGRLVTSVILTTIVTLPGYQLEPYLLAHTYTVVVVAMQRSMLGVTFLIVAPDKLESFVNFFFNLQKFTINDGPTSKL